MNSVTPGCTKGVETVLQTEARPVPRRAPPPPPPPCHSRPISHIVFAGIHMKSECANHKLLSHHAARADGIHDSLSVLTMNPVTPCCTD
jgi:hypothetical protein